MTTDKTAAAPAPTGTAAVNHAPINAQVRSTTNVQVGTDSVPDFAFGLRELAWWLESLAGVLDVLPQPQRRALLQVTRGLRADLSAIQLAPPAVTR